VERTENLVLSDACINATGVGKSLGKRYLEGRGDGTTQ
jgi:hypothetical protein